MEPSKNTENTYFSSTGQVELSVYDATPSNIQNSVQGLYINIKNVIIRVA